MATPSKASARSFKRVARAFASRETLTAYDRAFKYYPTASDRQWFLAQAKLLAPTDASVLDPTAGGGAIPFEAARMGLVAIANDLNPVAVLLEIATVEWPLRFGSALLTEFRRLADAFISARETRLKGFFPPEPEKRAIATNYLWARTVRCPYCEGLVPLSPNWRLAPDGTGVRLVPSAEKDPAKRYCTFEIVNKTADHAPGTVADGDATCPFPDCARVIDGDEIKRQAQAGALGEQLYAVVFKRRIEARTKTGRLREHWERAYRSPRPEDDNSATIAAAVAEKLPEWEALDLVPNEKFPEVCNDDRPIQYGMPLWRDMLSPRQLLVLGTSTELFRELLDKDRQQGSTHEVTNAAFGYLALSLDKLLNWNARLASWNVPLQSMRSVFDRHDFAFKWSYAEMNVSIEGVGYDWIIEQTAKCIEELVELTRPSEVRATESGELPLSATRWVPPPTTITCKSGDSLDHLADGTVDAVVMDPPYYDNVMYAELSDFFYVWLKRTAGQILPELFRRPLTDKENEAVANPAKFGNEKGAKVRAGRDYQERMAAIFTECRRVLKPSGIMTLMFTHKATGAWDALTKGLMEAGFTITASWPINTEAAGSLHIKDKAAANSTIFLACRPRAVLPRDAETQYWEEVEPLVAGAVSKRVTEFQAAGIRGVDLYLASFGPALEEFSKHWPLKRGTPNPLPPSMKRAQKDLFPEEWDPYAVSPEDALNAARREVKRWRLEQLTHKQARAELARAPRGSSSHGTPSKPRHSHTTKPCAWPVPSALTLIRTSSAASPKRKAPTSPSGTASNAPTKAPSVPPTVPAA